MTKPSARAAPLAKVTKERGRLAAAQADIAETKAAKLRGSLVDAAEVEAEWSCVLRTVRAGVLAVPSRVSQRLPSSRGRRRRAPSPPPVLTAKSSVA